LDPARLGFTARAAISKSIFTAGAVKRRLASRNSARHTGFPQADQDPLAGCTNTVLRAFGGTPRET
jgi:hypothetical protein